MSQIKSGFFQVPNGIFDLFQYPGFNYSVLKVLMYLLTYQNAKSIYPSIRLIAKMCSISDRSVQYSLRWLEEQKYIRIVSGKEKHSSSTYFINFEVLDYQSTRTAKENKQSELERDVKSAQISLERHKRESTTAPKPVLNRVAQQAASPLNSESSLSEALLIAIGANPAVRSRPE